MLTLSPNKRVINSHRINTQQRAQIPDRSQRVINIHICTL